MIKVLFDVTLYEFKALSYNRSNFVCFFNNRPSTKSTLFKLEDFAQAKIEKFGAVFLKIITSFCTENDLKMDDFPQIDIEKVSWV